MFRNPKYFHICALIFNTCPVKPIQQVFFFEVNHGHTFSFSVENTDQPKKSFHAPLKKCITKTMAEINHKVKIKNKEVNMDCEAMYMRIMAVNTRKKIPAKYVMSFENTSVPAALFKEDGSLLLPKNKAEFLHMLEGLLPAQVSVPTANCIIFDGHAVMRKLPFPSLNANATYRTMAEGFVNYITHIAKRHSADEIHIVFDKYYPYSTKTQARMERQNESVHCEDAGGEFHLTLDMRIHTNKEAFFQKTTNKEQLAHLYFVYLSEQQFNSTLKFYISGTTGDKASMIFEQKVSEVAGLASNQEESDTRMLLHMRYAADNGAKVIITQCEDTDVLVLMIHHRVSIPAEELYFLTGRDGQHTRNSRCIPVHTLHSQLSEPLIKILLPVYCLSGCDTTSCFFGRGKRTAFKVATKHATVLQELSTLGSNMDVPTNKERAACIKFAGLMYGKTNCQSLNTIRGDLAAKGSAPKKLPPTDDSFNLHVLRCDYQLQIWKQALTPMQELPSATNFGWYLPDEGRTLLPKMMTQSCAAPELLNDIICNCSCVCDDHCPCASSQQACTSDCGCGANLPGFDDLEEDTGQSLCMNPNTAFLQVEDDDT